MVAVKLEVNLGGLDKLKPEVAERVDLALGKFALLVEGGAKVTVPVRTGHLKNSIQSRRERALRHEVTVGADYGAHVEFGTVRMAARPYLTPEVERRRGEFERVMQAALRDAARRSEVR